MKSKAVSQYLQRYAEAEVLLSTDWPDNHRFSNVLVIPAYKESTLFLDNLISAPWFTSDVLVILVINQPSDRNSNSSENPQLALWQHANNRGDLVWQNGELSLLGIKQDHTEEMQSLLIVDRFSRPIPKDLGVGLARKIGTDIAISLIDHGIIRSQWIGSTDADATLPDTYFQALEEQAGSPVASCFDFSHITNNNSEDNRAEVLAATQQYEQAMRYYVAGLAYADSPYAFFSIGSIIAFKAEAYAKVRGFPKRPAGEDFYLLNKLAKIGSISNLSDTTILLTARLSDRVPFGTGVSVAKIIEDKELGKPFCYYHPEIFTELKLVLSRFSNLHQHRACATPWLETLPANSADALRGLGLLAFLTKQQKQPSTAEQFNRNLQDWFDGLKTLRFIHILREQRYPNIPLIEALAQAPFIIST